MNTVLSHLPQFAPALRSIRASVRRANRFLVLPPMPKKGARARSRRA